MGAFINQGGFMTTNRSLKFFVLILVFVVLAGCVPSCAERGGERVRNGVNPLWLARS